MPLTVENPAMSRLRLSPPPKRLRKQPLVSWGVAHHCQGETPRKKPTGLLGFRVNVEAFVRPRTGPRTCRSKTGKPHQIL
eukprot:7273868-Pyramimonas_sp.AAC.1